MFNKPKVLVLDDELTIHESISYALREYEIEIVSATSITEAASQFAQDPKSFVLAFIDHRLKQEDPGSQTVMQFSFFCMFPVIQHFNLGGNQVLALDLHKMHCCFCFALFCLGFVFVFCACTLLCSGFHPKLLKNMESTCTF